MSNTAGDPQSEFCRCPNCNGWHTGNICPNKYYSNGFVTATWTQNYDAEILAVLKEILKKLEEISRKEM